MSTRHLLNMTMGAFAMLLLAAIGVAFSTASNQGGQHTQIELAERQQVLVQDLTRQATALTEVDDREVLATARQNLARTVVQFDRNLTALLHGGPAVDAYGKTVVIKRTRNDMARSALEDGAHLWLETGMPLADLAAGEYSAFSAAGQKAIMGLQDNNVELMQYMGTATNSLRMSIHARGAAASIARWATAVLAVVLLGLGLFRRKVLAGEGHVLSPDPQHAPLAAPVYADASIPITQPLASQPAVRPQSAARQTAFVSPVNFDTVNASVDQMTVDMNTIAGSTENMRLAIDSVGSALQGMLTSLNEMAHDTAEGHKIVRGANNAASFTADAAGDLATSAREMAEVVARVTRLAHKTKNVAAQIEGEALHTGKTGEAFASVIAGEVKGLVHQTSQATREVDETVATIMLTARKYEEAIGQIIKNVSAINKVSQNLGELTISLPATAPLAPVVASAVAPEPVPEPTPNEPQDDPAEPEDSVADVVADTAAAIEDAVESHDDTTGGEDSNGNDVMPGGRKKKTDALNIPKVGRKKKTDALNIPKVPAPATEPVVEAPAVNVPESKAPEVEAAPQADGGSNGNVFMLNGPKKKVVSPEPAAPVEATPASEPPNIYGLELPDDLVAEPETEGPATESKETAPPEPAIPETVPAGDDDGVENTSSSANIFMLNKPK